MRAYKELADYLDTSDDALLKCRVGAGNTFEKDKFHANLKVIKADIVKYQKENRGNPAPWKPSVPRLGPKAYACLNKFKKCWKSKPNDPTVIYRLKEIQKIKELAENFGVPHVSENTTSPKDPQGAEDLNCTEDSQSTSVDASALPRGQLQGPAVTTLKAPPPNSAKDPKGTEDLNTAEDSPNSPTDASVLPRGELRGRAVTTLKAPPVVASAEPMVPLPMSAISSNPKRPHAKPASRPKRKPKMDNDLENSQNTKRRCTRSSKRRVSYVE